MPGEPITSTSAGFSRSRTSRSWWPRSRSRSPLL